MTTRNYRFDSLLGAESGIFFERELTDVRTEVIEEERPPRNIFEHIAQDTSKQPWANQYEHRMWDYIGVAQFISDWADDLPLVDIAGREEVFNMRAFGCAYQFSIDEIEASAALGRQIDRKRALAARLVTEEKFNRIGWFGDPATMLFGVTTYPYIPRRISSVRFHSTETADNMLAEMNAAVNSIFDFTETVGQPDLYLMAPAAYAEVSSRRLGSGTDTTVLGHFLENNPFFRDGKGTVAPLQELKGAGPNGEDIDVIGSNDLMIGGHVMAREFTQLSPQEKNLSVYTPCHAKSGGCAFDRPYEFLVVERPAS